MSSTSEACARFTCWAEPCGPHAESDPTVVIDLEGTGPEEHIFKLIRTQGRFYESDLLDHLAEVGPRGGVYVDVGANIGNHSVFFGRFLADEVVSIEPSPDLLLLLERNLRANEVRRWTTLPAAIGARPGAGQLVARQGYEGNAGARRVVAAESPLLGSAVEVDTLDRLLAELGSETKDRVRLVKLDIEGMELEALRGAVQLLDHQRPDVVVEAAAESDHAGVGSFLASYGYREVARFCSTPTYHFADPSRSWPRGAGAAIVKESP